MIKNLLLIILFSLSVLSTVAWSQSTDADRVVLTAEGNAKDFTKDQKDFLQATLDDLCKIGRKNTAENLNKYIAEGRVVFKKDDASVSGGYFTPSSRNILYVQEQKVDQWEKQKHQFDQAHKKGYSEKEKDAALDLKKTIRDATLTLIHEDVHMGQENPGQYPNDEDPAYETQIHETRRVIKEDMQKIQEILDRGAKLPGDQARLDDLIQDLKASKKSYNETINCLLEIVEKSKAKWIEEFGYVTPSKFKTAKADRDQLIKEADDLIMRAGSEKEGSFASLGWIMGTYGAFISRGNIVGGTDHLGFANCLCKCSCSQAGWECGISATCVYDANPKGECLCAGFGEVHEPVSSSGECYDNCAREYNITGMQSNKMPLVNANSGGKSAIMPGDLIQITAPTVIRLKDGSKLLVTAHSILKFTSTESGKIKVDLLSGFLRAVHPAGGSAGAGGPEVQIADRRVQPKGTEFVCQWDGGKGKVSVVDGSVSIVDETSEETIPAGEEMALPDGTVSDYNLSADDGGLVAGIPLRDLILDEGEPEPFGEYDPAFEGGRIPDDWVWQDPGSDAKLDSSSSGGLMVTVPDGNEFWGYPGVTAKQRSEAPRLLHKVTGDFDLQGRVYLESEATDLATVEFLYYSPGSNIGLKSGLMKQDLLGENYNLPGGGWLRAGGLNKLPVLGRPSEVTYLGYSAELKSAPDAPDEPVFLKFTRSGNVLKTYHSLDGENWILSSRDEVNVSQTIWVGWVFKRSAYDGLTDKGAVVTLDSVHLKTAESGSMPVPEWDQILQAGSAEVDGDRVRLNMDGSGKGVTGIQRGSGLIGDFQATVSFQTEDKTAESGESRTLALTASNYNGHNDTYIGWTIDANHVSQLYTTEFMSTGQGRDGANDYTNDWSGKLRMVRQDGNISTYFWKDGDWKVLGNFQKGYPDPVYLGLEVSNEREASANASMTAEFTIDEIAGNIASNAVADDDEDTKIDDSGIPGKEYISETEASETYVSGPYVGETDVIETDANDNYVNEGDGKETSREPGGETAVIPESESTVIFDNWNIDGVSNNPYSNPSFTITSPHMITYIDSYHWNDGFGTTAPGMIYLVKDDGFEFGPWQAEGQPGMNNVPNAFWIVHPYTVIPAGTYMILNSDRETWSQNSASGGCGFSKVQGYPDQSQSPRW